MMKSWKCQTCNNINSAYDKECARCNWESYICWKDNYMKMTVEEAILIPGFKGFSWRCAVCDTYCACDCPSNGVCPACGWEEDIYQEEDPNQSGGPNPDSLNERKAWWEAKQKSE